MKSKRIFNVRVEDVPVIGEFIVDSMERDMEDFRNYSPVFNPEFVAEVRAKIIQCKSLTRSWVYIKELKAVSQRQYDKIEAMRLPINHIEGYIKLSSVDLDLPVKDFGIQEVRNAIHNRSAEKLPDVINSLFVNIERNRQALVARGVTQHLMDAIKQYTDEINMLNRRQNVLEGMRNITTESDIEVFNDLWRSLQTIIEIGKALYRVVDKAKVKDYTIMQLEKRLHSSTKSQEKKNNLQEETTEPDNI